jgi:hypothetical protein
MDSSVSPKDETWFLRVCHHISNAVYPLRGRCVDKCYVATLSGFLQTTVTLPYDLARVTCIPDCRKTAQKKIYIYVYFPWQYMYIYIYLYLGGHAAGGAVG